MENPSPLPSRRHQALWRMTGGKKLVDLFTDGSPHSVVEIASYKGDAIWRVWAKMSALQKRGSCAISGLMVTLTLPPPANPLVPLFEDLCTEYGIDRVYDVLPDYEELRLSGTKEGY